MKPNAKAVPTSSRDELRMPRTINHSAAPYAAMLATSQNMVIKGSGIRGPGKEIRPRPRPPTPTRASKAAITVIKRILVSRVTEDAA